MGPYAGVRRRYRIGQPAMLRVDPVLEGRLKEY